MGTPGRFDRDRSASAERLSDADRLRQALAGARNDDTSEPLDPDDASGNEAIDFHHDAEYDALGDTAEMAETREEEAVDEPKSSPGVTAIRDDDAEPQAEPDELFDRLYDRGAPTGEFEIDPEAGQGAVAEKVRQLRQAASTPGGKLVTAVPIGLVGISLGITSLVFLETWVLVVAGIFTPLSLWLVWTRYQQWLGHKRYAYRLLESLGEDVSDWDLDKVYRVAKARGLRTQKKRRKGRR